MNKEEAKRKRLLIDKELESLTEAASLAQIDARVAMRHAENALNHIRDLIETTKERPPK